MSISNRGINRWLIRVQKRINGKVYNRKKIVSGTNTDAKKVEMNLIQKLVVRRDMCSLKINTFGEALTYYRENTDADLSRIETLFNRLSRDLGPVRLPYLSEKFSDYWRLLKTGRSQRTGELLSSVTKNRLLMYSKVALNFCVRRGLIEKNPLQHFEKLTETGRDRILTNEEQGRILNVMERRNSYLYYAFYFSLKNPIRIGDLRTLTRENLDWFKPWVHFYASKTRKRKKRETCLPFLDNMLMDYFKSLPGECPLLFPRIDDKGRWAALGCFKKHWRSILDEARVKDFHWHDLKHCAITWALDNGYTERDLKNLGIQYSPIMIDRYYHTDANKVLFKWKNDSSEKVVVPARSPYVVSSQ